MFKTRLNDEQNHCGFLHFAHFFGGKHTEMLQKKPRQPGPLDSRVDETIEVLGLDWHLCRFMSLVSKHGTMTPDSQTNSMWIFFGVMCWWCEHHLVLFLWCLKGENGGEQVLFEVYPHHKIRSWIDARSVPMGLVKNQPPFLEISDLRISYTLHQSFLLYYIGSS